jgi:NADH-quinone oxidoreductase subunit G
VIHRITPRRNDEVNDTWMADSGRLLYQQVRAPGRLTETKIGGAVALPAAAVAAAGELLRAGGVAVVASGRSSVEEQFLTKRLAEALGATVHLVSRVGQGDGILVSADRNPNVRGALVTGLIAQLPSATLGDLAAKIDAGAVKTVLAIGEDLAAAGVTPEQLAKVKVVYLGTQSNPTSAAAQVVLPTLTVFEKSGSFVNQQFRLQKFAAAIPAPGGAHDDLEVLAKLIAAVGGKLGDKPLYLASGRIDLGALWEQIAAAVPALGTARYGNIPGTGLLLDGTPWASLPFVEGKTLHYAPAAAVPAHG